MQLYMYLYYRKQELRYGVLTYILTNQWLRLVLISVSSECYSLIMAVPAETWRRENYMYVSYTFYMCT